ASLCHVFTVCSMTKKARLVALTMPRNAPSQSEAASRSGQNQDAAKSGGSSDGDFYCQQWVTYLKKWPIRQIEEHGSFSDDQLATLYELTATIHRATGKLSAMCHADERLTPPGRLDARVEQLKGLKESIDAISPVFARFANELADAQ